LQEVVSAIAIDSGRRTGQPETDQFPFRILTASLKKTWYYVVRHFCDSQRGNLLAAFFILQVGKSPKGSTHRSAAPGEALRLLQSSSNKQSKAAKV
jgi:hypothetical protein